MALKSKVLFITIIIQISVSINVYSYQQTAEELNSKTKKLVYYFYYITTKGWIFAWMLLQDKLKLKYNTFISYGLL